MFKSKKNKTSSGANTTSIDTMIGESTVVTGNLKFSGGLLIEGNVSGNVSSAKVDDVAMLILNEGGQIDGDITVPRVVINGTVNGDINVSTHAELSEGARINGNVYYTVLEMAPGAKINGSLVNQELEQEPEKKSSGSRVIEEAKKSVEDISLDESEASSST